MDKGNNRRYEKGRSSKGFLRGERIEKLEQLKPGDILFNVCHKQSTESLVEVINVRATMFDFIFVTAHETKKKGLHLKVKKGDEQLKAKSLTDLPFNECYRAITTKMGMKQAA